MDAAGASQSWDPARYARNARFVSDLAASLVDVLDPRPGERILDVGCGDGDMSERIAARGATVIGVDAAPDMLAAARARGIDARVMDGQELDFEAEFDAIFSNAALHWMPRADGVLAGVRRALRPGGRLVAEFGGHGNVAAVLDAIITALDGRGIDGRAFMPWYFPTVEAYRGRLEAHGFRVAGIDLFPRPTPLPGEFGDWLDTFAESFLVAVPEAERGALKDEVEEALRPKCRDGDGRWVLDYVRLRVAAHL